MRNVITIALGFLFALANAQNRPFPYAQAYTAGSIKPTNYSSSAMADHVTSFYTSWKSEYIVNGCQNGQAYVDFDKGGTVTVSEGMGYGMIISAYMADKTTFDKLYVYVQAHPSGINSKLMAWKQTTGCQDESQPNAATDGDIDIAYALLLADKQWGSAGSINYLQEAKDIIGAIIYSCVNNSNYIVKLGDWAGYWDQSFANHTRPSDFITYAFNAFENSTGNTTWGNVVDKCYSIVSHIQSAHSASTGLMPDFVVNANNNNGDPAPAYFLESDTDGEYGPNACRVPWRLGLDYLLYGDARAKTALDKLNAWLKTTANSNPSSVWPGYDLNGNAASYAYQSPVYTAPFAVGAMVSGSSYQTWLNGLYSNVVSTNLWDNGYYENTVKLLCMIAITGNWWSPDAGDQRGPFTLVVNAVNGTVSKNPDKAQYDADEVVTLTANPLQGYVFQQWSGDATGTVSPLQVTMSSDKSITASFLSTDACANHIDLVNDGVWVTAVDDLGSTLTPASPTANNGEINLTYNVVKDANWGAWVDAGSNTPDYATKFSDMVSLKITYKSTHGIIVSLPQYPLYLDGANYQKSLPASATWTTVELEPADLAIPSWYNGTHKDTPLILDSVSGVSIGPDVDVSLSAYSGTIDVNQLDICGVLLVTTHDNQKVASNSAIVSSYLSSQVLHVQSNMAGSFNFDVISVDGKVVQQARTELIKGYNMIQLEPLTSGIYQIRFSNAATFYTNRIFVSK